MMKHILLVLLYLTLSFTHAFAKEVKIKGQTVDSITLAPVTMTLVSVIDNSNKMLFTGMIESEDASFGFDKIKIDKGGCRVVISNNGYFTKNIVLDEQAIEREIDLGVIPLKAIELSMEMEQVTVVGNYRTRVSVDRTSYVIDSLRLKNVSTSIDLMRHIPEIAVDELKRKIRIMGKENTLVLLNGVNTGTSVDMRSINFRDVEKVEVITSPSSGTEVEYDGIINIILKPKARKGISVDLEESLKLDLHSNDTYVGVTWGSDKVRLKLTYDNYYRAIPYDIQQQRTDPLTDDVYEKNGYSAKPFELSHDIGLGLDYQITPRDFFNITTSTKQLRTRKEIDYSAFNIIDGTQYDLSPFNTRFANRYWMGNYTLYYRHSMKNKTKDYLSVNANFGFMDAVEDVDTKYQDGTQPFMNRELGNKFSTTLRVEYNNVLSDVFHLNTGVQGYFQDFKGSLNDEPNENNLKNYRCNLFADLNASVGKFQFRVGAKGEVNTNEFKDKAYGSRSQFTLMPTAAAIMKINNENTLKAEFKYFTYYPSAWMMAPYEIKADEKTISRGNPNLKLQQFKVFELTYTYRTDAITLNAIPYYHKSNNLVVNQILHDNELNTINTFTNGGKLEREGLRINGSLNFLGGAISIDPELSAAYETMGYNGVRRNNFLYRLGGTVMLYFPMGFGCGASGSYKSKALTTTGYIAPLRSIDAIFIMKSFDKLNLNVFAGYQSIVESADVTHTINDTYSQRDYFKSHSKGFMLRLNYSFTAGKSKRMERINTYFDNDRK